MSVIDPYKGVRDFYPEDERIQKHIFGAMRRASESFGYEEYNASVLESTELYTAKSSEEIVNEQTYTFTDRGDRSVTLRPEMTPTVARMVASRKRELGFPLRWYSIQNFFRYERPQRGRLREFWQLNADLFGVTGLEADAEVIALAYRVMMELGASEDDFLIKIGSRSALNAELVRRNIPTGNHKKIASLMDRKGKIPEDEYEDEMNALAGGTFEIHESPDITETRRRLALLGITNTVFNPEIIRGFDYYTGIVFEVFDTNPENKRSMFGGGRYDNLVGQYGSEEVPAVGFAMGDVIARDFLETHNLMPTLNPATHLYLAPASGSDSENVALVADTLRKSDVNVAVGMKHEKIGDHIKVALKLNIPHFAVYGEKEKESGTLTIKTLATSSEQTLPLSDVPAFLFTVH
ncbi:MAG: histidine--tRNA ligase [Patescibacteria group bacterium]